MCRTLRLHCTARDSADRGVHTPSFISHPSEQRKADIGGQVIRDVDALTLPITAGPSWLCVDMATGRKSSTSKGGGVRFPDETEEDPLSDCCNDTQQDKVITALTEPDGTYLVKVGFLKIQHKYEFVFTIPQVPNLGKDCTLSPALRTTAKPRLRATRIVPRPEGGVKVVCEYSAQQEGVVQEELTLVNRSRRDSSVRVKVQARVMDRHHGTPMLVEGVRCLGTEKEISSKTNDRKKI
uniref:Si:ch211-151p13.8 n=1 Tax=Astyanax mexicanus TaxID=7994 RepID=A0A8B9HD69_ASTMX